ncbi:maleylpyruvate isomerase N-terminal domain-containing protein [Streptomyces sp. MMG1121]|uniref:maleylpyruvate isomerase N-terminal domain-containing protein n=1 Tax=Streptomyces sp. MMG1121 TaxID=1415544 RepID=UPI0006B01480|nr:hypothetical protein ADK64_40795 [Streptomyces sp. MMG1121]
MGTTAGGPAPVGSSRQIPPTAADPAGSADLLGTHSSLVQRGRDLLLELGQFPARCGACESTEQLPSTLRESGLDRGCWPWWDPSESPRTCGAVARHQVQEVTVHTYDAEITQGAVQPLSAGHGGTRRCRRVPPACAAGERT